MPVVQTALSLFWTAVGVICGLFAIWFFGSAYFAPEHLERSVPIIIDSVQSFGASAQALGQNLTDKFH